MGLIELSMQHALACCAPRVQGLRGDFRFSDSSWRGGLRFIRQASARQEGLKLEEKNVDGPLQTGCG